MTISDKLSLLEQTKEAQRVKLGLPENIPFSQYVKFIRDPFTISELYKNGEQGVWLDPSDLLTMFQDVNGTRPVTKDGDPVALILDKSGNNNHATQTTASARPIYRTDGELHWLEFDGIDDKLQTSQYLDTQAGDVVYYNLKVDMLSKASSATWSIVSVNTETGNLQTGVIGVNEDIRIIGRYNVFNRTQLGKFNEVKHIEGYAHNVFVNNKYIDDYTLVGGSAIGNANTPGILIGAREFAKSHNNMKLYFLCVIKSQSELEIPNKLINYISNKGLTL